MLRRNTATAIRVAAVAGMVGPVLFAGVLLALTLAQYDFMLEIGWRALGDPSGTWPSGLALGPYGWAQVANFVLSGILLMIFAAGLHLGATDGRGSRVGPTLLFAAGTAMALMGFETDPIQSTGPRTLHNLIHDLAFALFESPCLSGISSSSACPNLTPPSVGHSSGPAGTRGLPNAWRS